MTTYTTPQFIPSEHGFKFTNRHFENAELPKDIFNGLGINFPVPDFFFGNPVRTQGRCGGMTYAALDFFKSQKFSIPADDTTPPDGNVLADYLLERQYDTFKTVGDEYIFHHLNISNEKEQFYNRCLPPHGPDFKDYKKYIDCNECRPLALFRQSGLIGHQVLGIGYTDDPDPAKVMIHVYDPDAPGDERVLTWDRSMKLWKLRTYENGKANYESHHAKYLSWLPLDGYRFEEPDIYDRYRGIRNYSGRDLRAWAPPQKQDLTQYCFKGTNFSGNPALESCDFEGVNAEGAFFMHANVSRSSFRKANLTKSFFTSANLRSTSFNEANVSDAHFEHTELSDANFEDVNAHGGAAYFSKAKCNKTCFNHAQMIAIFTHANIVHTTFIAAHLEDSRFDHLAMDTSNFKRANLNDTSWEYVAINTCDFKQAKLRGSSWNRAALDDCDFKRANLTDSSWEYTSIDRCDFNEWSDQRKDEEGNDISRLYPVYLQRANLRMAVIGRSNFIGISAYHASFAGANIANSNFNKAYLKRASFSRTTLGNVNFKNANLFQSSFYQANLGDIDFREAYLYNANFYKANLSNVDFRNANLKRANFKGVVANGIDLRGIEFENSSWEGADLKNVKGMTSALRSYLSRQGAKL